MIHKQLNKEFFNEKVVQIMEKYNMEKQDAVKYLKNMGPKKMKYMGLFNSNESWREGYTKPTIEKRRMKNRKKNKIRRKTNRIRRLKMK